MAMEPSHLKPQPVQQLQNTQTAEQSQLNEGTVQHNEPVASPTDLVHRKVDARTLIDTNANYKIDVEHLKLFLWSETSVV